MEIGRPERGLVAADALPDLQDHVLAVGRVRLDERELELLLEGAEPLLELRHELAQVAVAAGGLEVVVHLAPLLRELVRAFELLQPPPSRRRLAVVVVDGRVGQTLLRLGIGAFDFLDEFLDRHEVKRSDAAGVFPEAKCGFPRRKAGSGPLPSKHDDRYRTPR